MRIMMGMITSQYSRNLNTSLNDLNVASRRATIYRSFRRTSENPLAATKLYRSCREMVGNEAHQDSLGDVDSQLMAAQSAMQSIYNIVSSAESDDVIQAIISTMPESNRTIIANKMRQIQQAPLSPLSTKFGEKYLFGDTEMTETPFSVNDSGEPLCHGINMNTGKIETDPAANFSGTLIEFNSSSSDPITDPDTGCIIEGGAVLEIVGSGTGSETNIPISDDYITVKADLSRYKTNQDLLNLIKGYDKIDFSKIHVSGDMNRSISVSSGTDGYQEIVSTLLTSSIGQDGLSTLASEEVLANLGLGLRATVGANSTIVNSQSAFNSTVPGISFLGYGQDSSGISGNLYTLMGWIVDQLESDDLSMRNIQPYLDKFGEKSDTLLGEITRSGLKSNFLNTIKANLESMGGFLSERAEDVEYVDPGDVIMDFYMQQYAYNTAPSMGTKILSKSFIDFMTWRE